VGRPRLRWLEVSAGGKDAQVEAVIRAGWASVIKEAKAPIGP
jgi:hypothetical protein